MFSRSSVLLRPFTLVSAVGYASVAYDPVLEPASRYESIRMRTNLVAKLRFILTEALQSFFPQLGMLLTHMARLLS